MVTVCRFGVLCGFVAGLSAVSAAQGADEDFKPLPRQRADFTVQGHAVSVTYAPAIRGIFKDGKLNLEFRLDGDLSELQKSIGGILDGNKARDECGTNIDVSGTTLVASGNVARLSGDVHLVQWTCVKADVPEVHGLKVTTTTKIVAKTILVEQSFSLCVDLAPRIGADGVSVAFDATVTCARPSSDSLLGKFGALVDLEHVLVGLAQELVDKLKDKLTVAVPPDLAAYSLQLQAARFLDRGGGVLGLEATGSATVTPAQFSEILRKLLLH
jgi:hypothetical protein